MIRNVCVGLSVAVLGLIALAGLAGADPGCDGGACPEDCGRKVCRPKTEVKKVEKVVYSSVCHDFCYPCLCGFRKKHCDSGCVDGSCAAEPCGKCGHPHVKRALVLKKRTCEVLETKCVVEHEGCGGSCAGGACETGCAPTQAVVTHPVHQSPHIPHAVPVIVAPAPGPSQVPGRIVFPSAPAPTPTMSPAPARVITAPIVNQAPGGAIAAPPMTPTPAQTLGNPPTQAPTLAPSTTYNPQPR